MHESAACVRAEAMGEDDRRHRGPLPAGGVCGAEYGQACSERRGRRNGCRHRAPAPGEARSTWLSPSCGPARNFPDHHSYIRLVGAVPTDERTEVKAAVTSAW